MLLSCCQHGGARRQLNTKNASAQKRFKLSPDLVTCINSPGSSLPPRHSYAIYFFYLKMKGARTASRLRLRGTTLTALFDHIMALQLFFFFADKTHIRAPGRRQWTKFNGIMRYPIPIPCVCKQRQVSRSGLFILMQIKEPETGFLIEN